MSALAILEENKPTLTQLVLVNMPAGTSEQEAARVALKEITNFEMIAMHKPELLNVDKTSILQAVKQCISDNLTLAPSAGLVYLYLGRVCSGTNAANQKEYKDVLIYEPTSEGRINIAYQAGTILDHKRPEFTFDATGKLQTVMFEFLVPSYGGPRWEKVTFDQSYFAKWQAKSAAKFGGNANKNYTSWNGSIDPEFAASKAIKHALKKRGTNVNYKRNQEAYNKPMNYNTPNPVIGKQSEFDVVNHKMYGNVIDSSAEEIKPDQNNLSMPDASSL